MVKLTFHCFSGTPINAGVLQGTSLSLWSKRSTSRITVKLMQFTIPWAALIILSYKRLSWFCSSCMWIAPCAARRLLSPRLCWLGEWSWQHTPTYPNSRWQMDLKKWCIQMHSPLIILCSPLQSHKLALCQAKICYCVCVMHQCHDLLCPSYSPSLKLLSVTVLRSLKSMFLRFWSW